MGNTRKKGENIIITAHPFEHLANGDERLAKVKLAHEINALIKERSLKQKEAAQLLGITQPEVSLLAHGKLARFTFDRLYRCLRALDIDIQISFKRHITTSNTPAGIYVSEIHI